MVGRGLSGLERIAVSVGVGLSTLVGLIACREAVSSALVVIDRFAPKPGLSGVALLLLSPVAFLALLYVVEWVLEGFGRSMQSGASSEENAARRQ